MPKAKPIHKDQKALTPASDKSPALVAIDDSKRLKEIRTLVEANNKSSIDTNTIICQIYMESRFDAHAGAKQDARGLMQVQLAGVKQVFKYRKKKELGHMPSDKQTKDAFDEGQRLYAAGKLFDEATNIQIGTEYMQYWIDISSSIEEAYKKYRGLSNGVYYKKISACAAKLAASPDSMQILRDNIK
ncbi:MAG: transglycosylase SLT domain-containing protein [Pseudomonas sp.]|uniref:transglycosylase SLT domain-containing protein n=1 Tax=Pseudomonas sp. TaxID=306 RepID=UPI003D14BBAD